MRQHVTVNGRELTPQKATVGPVLGARTVLTKSPWQFVSLWLSRHTHQEALFYWGQAEQFARAAVGLPIESAPLLQYYSFMNATKALLSAKNVRFAETHGVGARDLRQGKKIELANEGVRIKKNGVLPALAIYLGDAEREQEHNLKDVLFNLPYIHRTFCLTYVNQTDQFLPLSDCRFLFDSDSGAAYLAANLSKDYVGKSFVRRLPASIIIDPYGDGERAVRSTSSVLISGPDASSSADLARMVELNREVRADLQYISGTQTLWYAKGTVRGPNRLDRSPLTLTLAAMHRLSEICRYKPLELNSFLKGKRNWLISEFVLMAPEQFIDGIVAEITGHQFMAPNVRPAN